MHWHGVCVEQNVNSATTSKLIKGLLKLVWELTENTNTAWFAVRFADCTILSKIGWFLIDWWPAGFAVSWAKPATDQLYPCTKHTDGLLGECLQWPPSSSHSKLAQTLFSSELQAVNLKHHLEQLRSLCGGEGDSRHKSGCELTFKNDYHTSLTTANRKL